MKFSKEDLFNELRTIILFEADHIAIGAGPDMAESFIGFSPNNGSEYFADDPSKVNLDRFQITSSFGAGYDYAFRPSVLNKIEEHEVQDLIVFMLGTPRAGGIGSGGETHQFMSPDGYCQIVADCVSARWKLEWDPGGHRLTTRELALLANMTEGAVRNALSDKTDTGLRPVPGSKNPVLIEHEEAWRWLNGRRGFIPTPGRPHEDRFLMEHLKSIETPGLLGELIKQRLQTPVNSPLQAAAKFGNQAIPLDWEQAEIDSWLQGTFVFDLERASTLAAALDFDVPLFVGKALEVFLRRNAQEQIGGRL